MRFFTYSAGLIFALTATLCVSAVAGEAPHKCHMWRAAELDVFPDSGNRPVVRISINGTLEYFLIDTAGIYNGISEKEADKLKLNTRWADTGLQHLASGKAIEKIAFVDQMKVGPFPISNVSLAVFPEGTMSSRIQGLIGGAFLQVFDLELDPAANKLSLFAHSDCGPGVVYWTHSAPRAALKFRMNQTAVQYAITGSDKNARDWHIKVPGKLDGRDVTITVDTGSDESFLQMGDAKDLLTDAEQKKLLPAVRRLGEGKDAADSHYRYPFKTLELAGLQIRNPKVVVLPGNRDGTDKLIDPKPQLILGDNVLNKLHIYIAYAEQKIYFTPADAH